MSTPKNCHYVTRGLTRPWEVDERKLWFYDFEKDAVRDLSSKSLFAENELLSPKAELRFKQVIEDPLIQLREAVRKNPAINNFEWNVFRAASLYFMGQVQRFKLSLMAEQKDESLEEFLAKEDSYFDQLVQASLQKYQIIGIGIPSSQQLFFPQAGFFAFFFLDQSQFYGFSSGFAVPLMPHWALAMIPKKADSSELNAALQIISPYSIGLGDSSKQVVIPPDVRANNSDELIREHMKEKRAQAKQMTADFLKMKGLVNQADSIAGLTPEEGLAAFETP